MLLAEFGLPSVSETKDGKRREIFTFKQGYSTAAKTGRTVFMVLQISLLLAWGKWLILLPNLFFKERRWRSMLIMTRMIESIK